MPKISDERRAERLEQILEGARRCFAENGYEGATVAKSQLFSVKEGLDYTVDEGGAAVMSEKGFERLTAAHRRGFEVVITVGDHVIFALPAEIAAA